MNGIAFYAGSFDPFTIGHFRIVCEALCSYDKVIIGIGNNPSKRPLFGAEDRKKLIQCSLLDFLDLLQNQQLCNYQFSDSEKKALERLQKDSECVKIVIYQGLTVDAALQNDAECLIRGQRNQTDEVQEKYLSVINGRLLDIRRRCLKTEVIPVSDENLAVVSSSTVKNLCAVGEYIAAMAYVAPSVHNALMKKYLRQVFMSAYREVVPGYFNGQPEKAWQELCRVYEKRAYHNLSHLAYGINYFNIYCSLWENLPDIKPAEFLFGWFYHDFVVGCKNAEEQSAAEIADLLYLDKKTIPGLIRATVHSPDVVRTTEAQELINDIDSAILGDNANYGRYSLGIRHEYADVKTDAYAAGRIVFLQKQLKTEIFRSMFFKCLLLEEDARANMQREVQYWQNLRK